MREATASTGRSATVPFGPAIARPHVSVARTAWKAIAGLGLFLSAVVGGLIVLLAEPYPPLLLGLGLLGVTLFLALRLSRALAIALATLLLLCTAGIVISQARAYTPPIVDAEGKGVPGSVASLEQVRLGGVDQWVVIRGQDVHNPVLLFLSGGPGGSELAMVRHNLAPLEAHFTVVVWEQRGSGKSFAAGAPEDMTASQLVSDAHELTLLLRQRFDQPKIYVLGASWGTILGTKLVQQYPELFSAYIGTGQMVNTTENDIATYNWALTQADQRGDASTLVNMARFGPPPYDGVFAGFRYANYLGLEFQYELENARPHQYWANPFATTEFGFLDDLHVATGSLRGLDTIYVNELRAMDFEAQVPALQLPVYLIEGRWDHNASPSIAERWFNRLQSPNKRFIWFEHSGHTPYEFEPSQFNEVMINTVLPDTRDR